MKRLALAALLALLPLPGQAFDLEAHRGGRGLMPENSLPAFANALSLGVTTLELDTGMTKDGHVVVAHDRRLNPAFARDPAGEYVAPPLPRLLDLTLDELRQFDIGRIDPKSTYAKSFPDQKAFDGTRYPTLREVFALVKKSGNQTVRFNIETKLSPLDPDEAPAPDVFVKALLAVIKAEGMERRVAIQSFDWRTLKLVQAQAPAIPTVYLTLQRGQGDNILAGKPGPSPWTAGLDIASFSGSVPRMVQTAGGKIWSPFYKDLTADSLRDAHALGLEVVVWTVNDPAEMKALIDMKVDGIITDYPDRLRAVMAEKGMALPSATGVSP